MKKLFLFLLISLFVLSPLTIAYAQTPVRANNQLINAQTGTSYAIKSSDAGKLITACNSSAQAYSIAQAGSNGFPNGYFVDIKNICAGSVTITPTTSTIDGSSTLVLTTGLSARINSDGANYRTALTGGGKAGGSNTQVQYNYNGVLRGDPALTFDNGSLAPNYQRLIVRSLASQPGGSPGFYITGDSNDDLEEPYFYAETKTPNVNIRMAVTGSGYDSSDFIDMADGAFISSGFGVTDFVILATAPAGKVRFAAGGFQLTDERLEIAPTGVTVKNGPMKVEGLIEASSATPLLLSNAAFHSCTAIATDSSGNATCSVSDERKKNLTGTFTAGLNSLRGIQPHYFTWKADPKAGQQVGLIAQNVKANIPAAVSETGGGVLQINQNAMNAVFVNSLNELRTRLEKVERENRELRRRLRRRR